VLAHRRWEALHSADLGWLRAKHHFRVDQQGNPAHHPLGALVVWNDDELAVGGGFPLHGHRNMEIVTYVRQGTLSHRDSLGSEGELHAGDVQVMSAGAGIRHAESNHGDVPLKLFQIWLQPRATGGEPRWETRPFPRTTRERRFSLLASGFSGDEDALSIRADARVFGATLKSGDSVRQELGRSRSAYLVAASGRVEVNGEVLGPGDGVAITEETAADIRALEDAELVMVDVG
jgi:quercetin 2,3-dioxygenase